ncbi:MAG: hypothetical protein ABEJ99_00015 [Candidatus Nanohaloarchaea archaeon]
MRVLKALMSESIADRKKIYQGKKLGRCLICGERVRTSQNHLTTAEGYTHKSCLKTWKKG